MMRKLLLAGAAILAGGTSAMAEEEGLPGAGAPGACLEWHEAMAAAKVQNPDAALVKVLDGAMARELIDVVNKLPPQSALDGDHAALLFAASEEQFLVVIGKGACARGLVALPAAVVARMLGEPV
jgi:hypothetical protein